MNYNVSNMSIGPLTNSIYVKPMEIRYTLNGVQKKWDYIQIHNSAAVIIFNVTRKVFVCVKQFRPTVYIHHIPLEERKGHVDLAKYPIEKGVVLEFCAGIFDKSNMSVEETAVAEVLEETGYEVPIEKLQKVRTYRANLSASADESHLFYVEVEDHMKKHKGGGLPEEGEFIEVVEIPFSEAKKICDDPNMDNAYIGLLYGFLWFFHCKAPALKLV